MWAELPFHGPQGVEFAQIFATWIQTVAILLSAVAAFRVISQSRRLAGKRATLDLIMAEESDPSHIELRRKFIDIRDHGDMVMWLTGAKSASEEAAVIRSNLNRYELVAIGIRNGAVDQRLYKEWCRTTLVKDWIAAKPFVAQLRLKTGSNVHYIEFERLASRWALPQERAKI